MGLRFWFPQTQGGGVVQRFCTISNTNKYDYSNTLRLSLHMWPKNLERSTRWPVVVTCMCFSKIFFFFLFFILRPGSITNDDMCTS